MLSPLEDQENLPARVAALVTPARQPLKSVVDSRVNHGTPTRQQCSDLSKKFPFKHKRKSKRLSAPVHNLYQLIPALVKSITLTASPVQEQSLVEEEISVCDVSFSSGKGKESLAEKVIGEIMREKESKEESMPWKMDSNELIILQMNKERLRLEKQLSQFMKEQSRTKITPNGTSNSDATNTNELERTRKAEELYQLKQQCDQLQEMLLEVPRLKKDLHKSKQETKGLSEILFASRKKTVQLEDHVKKLNKQVKDNEKLNENCTQLQKSLESVTQERDQNAAELKRLGEDLEQKENEIQRNRDHCITLKALVDRLENASSDAECYVASSKENETILQYQIDELSLSLESNLLALEGGKKLFMEREEELKKSRESEKELRYQYEKQSGQLDHLTAELDIAKMEISRQEDVIMRQQREMEDLKVKLANSLEQIEYIQMQQQEMNEFTEEERRNLEVTVCEMENELKLTKQERTEMDASLRRKSQKYDELVQEVKHSRYLLQDKQEELDATQSQAHWIVLKQEAVIADTTKELREIWDLVNDLLVEFNKEAFAEQVHDDEKAKRPKELKSCTPENDPSKKYAVPLNKSLVQSILEATAMRDRKLEFKTPEKRCHKLSPIPEVIEEDQDSSQTSEDEEKLPSLTTQAVELKQALTELTKICRNHIFTVQAQNTVDRLLKERIVLEERHRSSLDEVMLQLEESRKSETNLGREISRKNNQITTLQQQLEDSRNDLHHSFQKIESLSEQYEKTIDQQATVTGLTNDVLRFSEQVKTLQKEKDSLSQQLKESLDTLNQLSQISSKEHDLNKTQDVLGKLLAEKFNLEDQVRKLKEKSVIYRLETQDHMTEYKCRTDSKIRVLESNIQRAETEMFRLDGLVQKIKLVLHQYDDVIKICPDLNKLLSFLDGEDIH